MSLKELEHLKFIYERLIYVHKEKSNYDYMLRFKEILQKLDRELRGE